MRDAERMRALFHVGTERRIIKVSVVSSMDVFKGGGKYGKYKLSSSTRAVKSLTDIADGFRAFIIRSRSFSVSVLVQKRSIKACIVWFHAASVPRVRPALWILQQAIHFNLVGPLKSKRTLMNILTQFHPLSPASSSKFVRQIKRWPLIASN